MVRDVIVLDTHALVWWTQQPELLGNDAAAVIAQSDRILVPAICFWETSLLVRKGRLSLKRGQPVDEWASEVSRTRYSAPPGERFLRFSCRLDDTLA